MVITKEKFELEFLLKTTPRVLEKMITRPEGLAEWFCDDCTFKNDIATFSWNRSTEEAKLIHQKGSTSIKWQLISDLEEGLDTFCEISFDIDPLTNVAVLKITDFADDDEVEESIMLWEKQIHKLKTILGA